MQQHNYNIAAGYSDGYNNEGNAMQGENRQQTTMRLGKQYLLEFGISTGSYGLFADTIIEMAKQKVSAMVCVANVHMFAEAYRDKDFLNIVNQADIVTPDGKPLTYAMRLLYNIKQDRVAGMDLLPDLLQRMVEEKLSVFFYGGSEKVLGLTEKYLQEKYPGVPVAGLYSPPYRQLTAAEEAADIEKIKALNPAIVFVVLGCPKQEKWMATVKGKINAVMIGVGGALPVMIGEQKRAPEWMQKYALEWLYRLYQEPKRLFKRYASTNSLFVWLIFKEFIKVKVLSPFKRKA
jgi:N-acetylglucosaminyldiphosphoundecaprenol N-acetyl-beta-D-mannosaminyltransferase